MGAGGVEVARVIDTGQALVDLVVEVPDLPARGGNVTADADTRYAGGSVNILVAAARTGASAVLAGAHGTGINGDLIRSTLAAEGVPISPDPVPGMDTGLCLVLIEPSGERTFITTRGAERQVSIEGLRTSRPEAGDLICVTGYSLLEPAGTPLLGWLEQIADGGAQVVFDPGAVFVEIEERVRARMLALTSIWTSNAEEAQDATGEQEPARAAQALRTLLRPEAVVIVRDGPHGCYLNVGSPGELPGGDGSSVASSHSEQLTGTVHVPGYPQHAVDTNGAGDAHTGVLAAERVLGSDWHTAAVRANVASAIKVTRKGPATAPTRAEVDQFLLDSAAG